MATRFLAPSMRQVVHPVRRLPRHSTRMLQEGKMEGGMVNSIPIHDAAIHQSDRALCWTSCLSLNLWIIWEDQCVHRLRRKCMVKQGWKRNGSFRDNRDYNSSLQRYRSFQLVDLSGIEKMWNIFRLFFLPFYVFFVEYHLKGICNLIYGRWIESKNETNVCERLKTVSQRYGGKSKDIVNKGKCLLWLFSKESRPTLGRHAIRND